MRLVGVDGVVKNQTSGGHLAVAADDRRYAWTQIIDSGVQVMVSDIDGQLVGAPLVLAQGRSEGWWRNQVIVSQPSDTDVGTIQLSLWTPGGSAPARWSTPLAQLTVLGPSPDERYLVVALETGQTTCLAELDPDDALALRARVCPTGLTTVPSESPSHRWAVTTQYSDSSDIIPGRWYDLSVLFDHPTSPLASGPTCPRNGDGDTVWEDGDDYLLAAGSTLVRCSVGSQTAATVKDPRLTNAQTVRPLTPTTV
jgi:hypothetical protein